MLKPNVTEATLIEMVLEKIVDTEKVVYVNLSNRGANVSVMNHLYTRKGIDEIRIDASSFSVAFCACEIEHIDIGIGGITITL